MNEDKTDETNSKLNCPRCGKNFMILMQTFFDQHVKSCGSGRLTCDVCQAKFSTKHTLKRHMLIHLNIKQFNCSICNKSFRSKYYFMQHAKTHEDLSLRVENRVKCDYCDKSFQWKSSLRRHLESHQLRGPYICPCGFQRATYHTFRYHTSRCSQYSKKVGRQRVADRVDSLEKAVNEDAEEKDVFTCQDDFSSRIDFDEHVKVCENGESVDHIMTLHPDKIKSENINEEEASTMDETQDNIYQVYSAGEKVSVKIIHRKTSKMAEEMSLNKTENPYRRSKRKVKKRKYPDYDIDDNYGEIKEDSKNDLEPLATDETAETTKEQSLDPSVMLSDIDDEEDESNELKDLIDSDIDDDDDTEGKKKREMKNRPEDLNILLGIKMKCTTGNCGEVLSGLKKMRTHKTKEHNEKLNFLCSFCDRNYTQRSTLQTHLSMSHYNQEFAKLLFKNVEFEETDVLLCVKCMFLFRTDTENMTILEHTCSPKPLKYYCPFCQTSLSSNAFETYEECERHVQSSHATSVDHSIDKSSKYQQLRSAEHDVAMKVSEGDTRCWVCKQKFEASEELRKHVNSKHASHPYCCGVCRLAYGRRSSLVKHMLSHDPQEKCAVCGKGFVDKTDLKRHTAVHTGEKPSQCEHCGKRFCSDAALLRHIRDAHSQLIQDSGDSGSICHLCGKTFHSFKKLKQHLSTHQETEKETCKYCLTVIRKGSRESHKFKCLSYKQDSLDKVMLPKDLACKKSLYQTLILCENDKYTGKNFKCVLCSSRFRTRKFTVNHIARCHTFNSQKKLICNVCGKGFTRHRAFQIHLRSHSGAKPYKCRICGKSFRQVGHVKGHLKSHGEQAIKCHYCSMKFKTKESLGHHVLTHCTIAPYKCMIETCQSSFKSLDQLLQHFKQCVKNAKQPLNIICKICNTSFKDSADACEDAIHHKTELLVYRCEVCSQMFPTFKKLYFHMEEKKHFIDMQETNETNKSVQNPRDTADSRNFSVEQIIWDGDIDMLLEQYDYIEEEDVNTEVIDSNSQAVDGHGGGREEVEEKDTENVSERLLFLAKQITNRENDIAKEKVVETLVQATDAEYDIGHVLTLPEESENAIDQSMLTIPEVQVSETNTSSYEDISVTVVNTGGATNFEDLNVGVDSKTSIGADTKETAACLHDYSQTKEINSTPHNHKIIRTNQETIRKVKTAVSSLDEVSIVSKGEVSTVLVDQIAETFVENVTEEAVVKNNESLLIYMDEENTKTTVDSTVQVINTSGGIIYIITEEGELATVNSMADTKHLHLESDLAAMQVTEELAENKCPSKEIREIVLEKGATGANSDLENDKQHKEKSVKEQTLKDFQYHISEDYQVFQIDSSSLNHVFNATSEKSTSKHHAVSTNKDKSKKYVCSECGKGFPQLKYLNFHKKYHLNSAQKQYKCTECGQGFHVPSQLEVHMRSHSGARPFKCPHCDKCFKQRGHLQTHVMLHEDNFPHQCSHCEKKFRTGSQLKVHTKRHHGTIEIKGAESSNSGENSEIICEKCNKTFVEEADLIHHKMEHLSETEQEKLINSFSESKVEVKTKPDEGKNAGRRGKGQRDQVCDICGEMVSANYIVNHLARHKVKEGKLLKCQFCHRRFFENKEGLEKHVNELHKEHLQCDKCGVKVVSRSKLNWHKKTCHTEREIKCSKCCRSFVSKSSFVNHVAVCFKNKFQKKLEEFSV